MSSQVDLHGRGRDRNLRLDLDGGRWKKRKKLERRKKRASGRKKKREGFEKPNLLASSKFLLVSPISLSNIALVVTRANMKNLWGSLKKKKMPSFKLPSTSLGQVWGTSSNSHPDIYHNSTSLGTHMERERTIL